jgi:hypothetical protein
MYKINTHGYKTYIKFPIQIKFGFQNGRLLRYVDWLVFLRFAHGRVTRVATASFMYRGGVADTFINKKSKRNDEKNVLIRNADTFRCPT